MLKIKKAFLFKLLQNYKLTQIFTSIFLVFIAFIGFILIISPNILYNRAYTADVLGFTDAFLRLEQGVIPHVDFLSQTGFLSYYIPYFFMKFGVAPLNLIKTASAFFALFALVTVLYLQKITLKPVTALCLGLLTLTYMLAQINIADDPRLVTGAMFYSRISYALTLLLMLFLTPQKGRFDWIFISLIIIILTGFKITFGLVSFSLLVVYYFSGEGAKKQALFSFTTVIIFYVILELTTGITSAYVKNIITLGTISKNLTPNFYAIIEPFTLIVIAIAIPLIIAAYYAKLSFFDISLAVLTAFMGVALGLTSFQNGFVVIPLAFLFLILNRLYTPFLKGIAVTTVLLFTLPLIVNVFSVFYYGFVQTNRFKTQIYDYGFIGKLAQHQPRIEAYKSVEIIANKGQIAREALIMAREVNNDIYAPGYLREYEFAHTISHGAETARQFCPPQKSVQALDFISPYNAILGLKPSGYFVFVHPTRNISKEIHPTGEVFFKGTSCILEPLLPHTFYTTNFLKNLYKDYLAENFELKAENNFFKVYVKR